MNEKARNQGQIDILGKLQRATDVQTELNLDIIQQRKASFIRDENERVRRNKEKKSKRRNSIDKSPIRTRPELYESLNEKNDRGLFNSVFMPETNTEKYLAQNAKYDQYIDFRPQLELQNEQLANTNMNQNPYFQQ